MHISAKGALQTLDTLTEAMEHHKRVFFTRFGDGEIYVMEGKGTADQQAADVLTQEMRKAWAIRHPQYFKGVSVNYPRDKGMIDGVLAPFPQNEELEHILIDQMGEAPGSVYENPVVFHYLTLFRPELMVQFLERFVRPRPKMFIGSVPQELVELVFGSIDYYVQTPAKDAYHSIDEWYPKVLEHLPKVAVVLPTAGAASKAVQERLWHAGAQVHSLDIGSLVDAVQQQGTRRWIRLLGHRSRRILVPGWDKTGLVLQQPLKELKQEIKYSFHRLLGR
ncbi:hypothetical protein [Cesiribacter andamanensis]|uniref:Uncharacterized protein n=1 Tax=Cesiribacter andamanensis AMV16 TaxID=1279009 RepID=M7N559_9BACT|nr:hypothetical protein [Cesiribacter andamanensis]EMR02351.1 hypothetical protein ADICEAN_02500 [Cesiribacter andamanensis AMV16]